MFKATFSPCCIETSAKKKKKMLQNIGIFNAQQIPFLTHKAFWIIYSIKITFEFNMHALFLFPRIWLECPLICTLCPTYPNLTAIFTLLFNAPSLGQWVTWIKGRQSGLMLSNATQEFEWENLKNTLENVLFIIMHCTGSAEFKIYSSTNFIDIFYDILIVIELRFVNRKITN